MSKTLKKTLKGVGIVAVGLAALGVALFTGVALTQAQEPTPEPPPGGRYGPRSGMMGGGYGWMADYREQMHAALAEALGMTEEEFEAARFAQGKSLVQIAEEQGLSADEASQALADARAKVLDQMVADGVITQEQADWMASHMQGGSAQRRSFYGPGGMMLGGGGRGARGGVVGCPYYITPANP